MSGAYNVHFEVKATDASRELRRHARRLCLIVAALMAGLWPNGSAHAQATPPSDDRQPERTAQAPFGTEIALGSGHADRGFIINDYAVLQAAAWVTTNRAEFSLWGSAALVTNRDGARPQILEVEATREYAWLRLSLAPALRVFHYRDSRRGYTAQSVETWLYLSIAAGPLRLFSNHSVDVAAYRGAYFGEAGIDAERELPHGRSLGASAALGWASADFTAIYADVAGSGIRRLGVEAWFTTQVTPRWYIEPRITCSALTSGPRTGLARPTFLLFRLTTGVEF